MSQEKITPKNIKWDELGFNYIQTDYRFIAHYKDGAWNEGKLTDDPFLHIHEGSTGLHYGQQAFEGMKAYRTKDGSINLFRPYENAKRMQNSADRLMMESFPVDDFVEAVRKTVEANADWVPPYGTGASLYIRPLLFGTGPNIGVKAADEYIFTIFVMPVGPYYADGMSPSKFIATDIDRAAPNGTGAAKAGGNYAGSLKAGAQAKAKGYGDAIYLNPSTHEAIEEVGSANFFAITNDDTFVTPDSPSVLPGITRKSLMFLAENVLGLKVEMRPIKTVEFANFKEAGACGTAAVITPIAGIQLTDKYYEFYSDTEVGPISQKLYDTLVGIQYGDIDAPEEDWIVKI